MRKSNANVAAFLKRISSMLEISGELGFKVRAYRNAADAIEDLEQPVADIYESEGIAGLRALPGIGKSLGGQIAEILETGTSESFERLRLQVPDSVADLMRVRGIGIKMAQTLYRDFGVIDLDDLVRFAEGGGFEAVPGLGDKIVDRLVSAVLAENASRQAVPFEEAAQRAESLVEAVSAFDRVEHAMVAGAVRRGVEVVRELDLVAEVREDALAVVEAFLALPQIESPVLATQARAVGRLDIGILATLHLASSDAFWVTLVTATGSRRHVLQLAEVAGARGLDLGPDGLVEAGSGRARPVPVESEEALYDRLGLRPIPPAEREGTGEVAEARRAD